MRPHSELISCIRHDRTAPGASRLASCNVTVTSPCTSDTEQRPTVLAVVGPTATGKSELAVALAQRLGGEIVNADSMQLYRGMDIGTAKLPEAERGGIPHHLLDV